MQLLYYITFFFSGQSVAKNVASFFNFFTENKNPSATWTEGFYLVWTQNQYSVIDYNYLLLIAACAAARRAIGTRNGEQET